MYDVQKDEPELYGAACQYFGTWEDALKIAGYNYPEVCRKMRDKDLRAKVLAIEPQATRDTVSRKKARKIKTQKPRK